MKKNNRGFTLIELFVVVVILGVIGGLLYPRCVVALAAVEQLRKKLVSMHSHLGLMLSGYLV